eukprot:XP_001698578.1 predicted protein [Chlamydomonas reinhardtii]
MSRQGMLAGLLPLCRQRHSLVGASCSSWRSFSATETDAGPSSSGRVAHLTSRGVLLAEGPQALTFLQGMVTNDVRPLQTAGPAEPPVYATVLTPKGKFLHDLFISRHPDMPDALLLEVDAAGATAAMQLLNKPLVAAGPAPAAAGLQSASAAGEEAYRAWRYSLGVAEGEAEIPAGQAAPLDFNVDVLRGVSYTKGCYVGQERNSFTHYRGVIRKRLMPVRLEATAAAGPGPALPAVGLDVLDAATGKSHIIVWIELIRFLAPSSVLAGNDSNSRKTSSRRKGHTLEDVLIANVTPADVAHNDAMRFVREGVAYMESLGVKLSEQCEKRYGYTFITDQKYHHFRLCKSEARLNDDGTLSGILSTAFEPDTELPELTAVGTSHKSSPSMPRNVGYKDAQLLCVGRNVVLDTCAHYDGQAEGFNVRFPAPKVGSVKLGCSVKVQLLGERNLTKGYKNRLWWANAQDNAYDVVRQSCDPAGGRVVEHPVAFVIRDRYTHTLHELEVLSTIFTSLAVADLPEVRAQGVQIVLADQMPHASYRPTYAAISYPYRLRHLAEAPYPPNTCFRTALFINAFTNSIAFNPNPNTSDCFSPVMIGVHKWLRTLHKELDPAYLARVHHHAAETGGIIRRQVVWTSRRNLEALRLTSGTGMTEWQSARMVPNENAVVTALQLAILEWNSRSCLLSRYYGGDEGLAGCRAAAVDVQFDLVFGEFSDWPYYPDQLMTIYRTGILIGVHGAALTFVTSTAAGESALLELAGVGWEDTQTGNMLNLFPSLAHNMGAYYEQVRYQGPDIDIKVATDALVRPAPARCPTSSGAT